MVAKSPQNLPLLVVTKFTPKLLDPPWVTQWRPPWEQTTVVLEWFAQNLLIANIEKFHLMFLSTDKTEQLVNEQLFIGDKTLNSEPCITLLGMDIDNLLTFNKHIADLYKKAASQLNVLKRLSRSVATLRENLSCKRLLS